MSNSDSHPALDDPNAYVLYRYVPSRVAAIIFVVAFGLTTLAHIFQLVKKKTWYFIPLVIGGLFETTGFIGRCLSHDDVWALDYFIMQALLILVAPALFAASIYIILGRIILLVDGERYSLVRQKWLTKTFVAGDVFSFLLQSGGGGIQAKATLDAQKLGEKCILAGLFVQLIFFAFFIVVAGVFHHRFVNDRPLKSRSGPSSTVDKARKHRHLPSSSSATQIQASISRTDITVLPWKRHLYTLYFTSALILVRSLFRVIEYIQGHAGYLLGHEVYLYVFDALLMLFVMVSFNWVHPSQVTELYQERLRNDRDTELRRTRKKRLGRDEERLVETEQARVGVHRGGWIPSRQP